jgi:DNA (cytosine-5)-methyltransferase 1
MGFARAGFEVVGVDVSETAGRAFELNKIGKFVRADISKESVQGDFDIIIGGPPCKPWSAVNTTRRGKNHRDYQLLSKFFRNVERQMPRLFVLENVPLLANDETLRRNVRRLSKRGYSIMGRIMKYGDYGAPTSRHRFFLFGTREKDAARFFDKLSAYSCSPKTVKDVIWNLRNKQKGEVPDHVWPELKTIDKYMKNYVEKKFGWYILKWNEPAPSFGNIMKTYILHPDSFNGRPTRVISVREALLIMGFDEAWEFPERVGLGAKYQMIVDAVSPIFSYAVANAIRDEF